MEEWKEYKLGDLCDSVCSGGTPSSKRQDYYDGNIPWLNTKEVNFNRIYSTERNITEDGLNNSSAKWISENSVIVAMYGATAGKTAIAKIPLTTNQACCNLTINSKLADYRFIYYYLCNKYTILASLANGGAQQNLNAQIIKDFIIKLPSLSEQNRISDILSSLDDKIENNRKINENLEQQAQALFKSWFVDFEPFRDQPFVESELGMIPEGWRVGTLSEFGTIICGKTPSKANPDYYDGDYPFIKIPDMHGNIFPLKHEEYISEIGAQSQPNKLIPPFSLLVSCIATVGLVSINTVPSFTNQQINSIIVNNESSLYYLYLLLSKKTDELQNLGRGGTATLNVNTKIFSNSKVIIPSDNILILFNEITSPVFSKILNNAKESLSFSQLRDTLLPRLMSGELSVK